MVSPETAAKLVAAPVEALSEEALLLAAGAPAEAWPVAAPVAAPVEAPAAWP